MADNTRGPGGKFAPGTSGNPGGRPKGLAAYIRERTGGGRDCVDAMVSIMDGSMRVEDVVVADGCPVTVTREPSHKERREAAKWLAERGCGKELDPSEVEHHHEMGPNLSALVSARLLELIDETRPAPLDVRDTDVERPADNDADPIE
jgi:hypothetical protein